MKTSETDIECLELYLDEELSTEDRDALLARLAVEPVLADELTRLRNDRELRFAVFSSGGEFGAKSIDEMILSVRAAQASEALRRRRTTSWRMFTSAAAALVVGVVLGSVASFPRSNPSGFPTDSASFGGSIGSSGAAGLTTTVNFPSELPQPYGQHVVIISNANGQILQRLVFPTAEAAQQYIEDFRKQQSQVDRRSTQEIKVMSESY